LITVTVSSSSKTRSFKALIDSGSDITVMDKRIADLLDIDLIESEKGTLLGVDAGREGYLHEVSLQTDGFGEVCTFRVLFIEDLHKDFDVILGQQDFFRRFIVRFERHQNTFYLALAPTADEQPKKQ
jgi:hypothetical protein